MTWPVQLSVWEKGDQSDQCATPRQSHQAICEHIRSLLILVILVNMEILPNIILFCQVQTESHSVTDPS